MDYLELDQKKEESEIADLKARNEQLEKRLSDLQTERNEQLNALADLLRPVVSKYEYQEAYDVELIAEDKAREALDDFDISEFSSEISEIARDDFDINDWSDEIRSICGLDDEITDAPNQLDDIREIIREELSGAFIKGQISLNDD